MAYLIIYYLFDGSRSDNILSGHHQIDNIIDRVRAGLSILLTIIFYAFETFK